MTHAATTGESLYVLRDRRGRRAVIYRPEAIGAPFDHEPGRWYFAPHPVPLGYRAGPAFVSVEAAAAPPSRQPGLRSRQARILREGDHSGIDVTRLAMVKRPPIHPAE